MNVLYIANLASIHDRRWINFFAERGNVQCYVIGRKWHVTDFLMEHSVPHPRVSVLGFIDDPSTIKFWRNWSGVYRIWSMVRKHRIQLIHVLYAEPNALWARWEWALHVPFVITTRGTDVLRTIPQFFTGPGLLNMRVARAYAKAFRNAAYVTCTSFSQLEALRTIGISPKKVQIVRTGVNFDMLRNACENACGTYAITRPFILMPRKMSSVYYHEFTIDAIAMLPQSIRRNYQFIFVDSDKGDADYVKLILEKARGCEANITFLPAVQQPELLGLLCRASLVVMNPLSDGSPVTAMEAMACRRPLILPPLPYDPEVFASAFFFESWSPESLSDKIKDVLSMDGSKLAEIVHQNYETIFLKGNTETELGKVELIYKEMLSDDFA